MSAKSCWVTCGIVAHAALTLANAWLVEQIRATAVTDGLTGIANRREFDTWLEGAGGTMCDWNGEPLHAGSDGHVLAIGDPARLEDVLEALGGQ